MLIPYLYPEYRRIQIVKPKTKYKSNYTSRFCFVPHYHDRSKKELTLFPSVNIISVNNSWKTVVTALRDCDYVASSSLHGIIVADSMGIPSRWFQFARSQTKRTEGTFKYLDYYESINRANQVPLQEFHKILDVNIYNPPLTVHDRLNLAQRTLASFPFHLFMTEVIQSKPKVLVIIMGTLRGGNRAWNSFYKHMLIPNEADLALMVPKDTPRNSSSLFQHAKYIWSHEEYDDWGVKIDRTLKGNGKWRDIAKFNNGTGLFGGTKEAINGSGAIIFMVRVFISKVLVHDGILDKYDRFVLTRSDQYYGCTHNIRDLNSHYLWLPRGEDYNGITDRHVILNRSHVLKALNILPPVIAHPERYMNLSLNPEMLIKMRWIEEGLWPYVRRFDRMMFTCAEPRDQTRWMKINPISIDGLHIKYPVEYNLTKETCSRIYTRVDY